MKRKTCVKLMMAFGIPRNLANEYMEDGRCFRPEFSNFEECVYSLTSHLFYSGAMRQVDGGFAIQCNCYGFPHKSNFPIAFVDGVMKTIKLDNELKAAAKYFAKRMKEESDNGNGEAGLP